MKDYKYINTSEIYELNDALSKHGKRETESNRKILKIEIDIYKIDNDKERVTHQELNEIIKKSGLLDDKD